MHLRRAALPVLAALLLTACPDDPWADFEGARIDLDPWIALEGDGAMAGPVTEADLAPGTAAQARTTDFVLQNDRIRVVVQGHDRHMGPSPYGGNIIDAVVLGDDGPTIEEFGELALLLNFGRTSNTTDIRVIRDGAKGGSAVLAVTGRDVINDFINVPALLGPLLEQSVGGLILDPEQDLGLVITQYYVLDPGATRVQIVSALRNAGTDEQILAIGDFIDRGGDVDLFNPARTGGSFFGYPNLPLPEPLDPYLAYVGQHSAYAYAPREDEPSISLTMAGVTGTLVGAESLFDFTGEFDRDRLPPGARPLAPEETAVVVRDFYVGRDLGEVTADWHAAQGTGLGTVSGTLASSAGVPSGARVAALDSRGKTASVMFVAPDGSFSGRLPEGDWDLMADAPGHPFTDRVPVTVAAGAEETVTLTVPPSATVDLVVRTPAGDPVPAKVTFACSGTCPKDLGRFGGLFRDVGKDPLGADVQHMAFVGPSGEATLHVPPGAYDIVVSRGPEWSVWPATWPTTAEPITLAGGERITLRTEIAPVLDTSGWISADLHVHGINSPDSPVLEQDRVLSFLGHGVEVLVSTDHDFVTDYAPYVEALGAGAHLATVVGEEITTFEWGHFNAFPLTADPDDLNGGAIDWGGGDGPTLTPAQLFEQVRAHPGAEEKVLQVNHPRGTLGHFSAIGLDTATGKTTADPTLFRMPTAGVTADDTGLFDPSFTAIEIYNGFEVDEFVSRLNDWFAFLQRGLVVTATAVSDTHRLFSLGVGNPHSRVFLGAGRDTPASFDAVAFTQAINAGRLVGGNGPMIHVEATRGSATAGIGEVLAGSAGEPVTLTVTVEAAAWTGFDTIELYANTEGTDTRSGEENFEPPVPFEVAAVDLSLETPVAGAGLAEDSVHRRWRVTRTFQVNPTVDTWYVVIVKGQASSFPVILEKDVGALAFTNAVFVDADGDGQYTAPRSFEKVRTKAAPQSPPEPPRTPLRKAGPSDLLRLLDDLGHGH